MKRQLLITCEHGGNRIPRILAPLFFEAGEALTGHRGWDPGALGVARTMAARLRAPLEYATLSRLVVDLNRSPGHPHVFSEFTKALNPDRRARALLLYHTPYRQKVDGLVGAWLQRGRDVVHVSVHSFTPVLHGVRRTADLSLLYDPAREAERALASRWVRALSEALPELAIRRNQPYRGTSDGVTTWLRRHGPSYRGIEVEINQRLLDAWGAFPDRFADALARGLVVALG